MQHKELTETIIGCAYHVFNEVGYGTLASVYEKYLMINRPPVDPACRAVGLAKAGYPVAMNHHPQKPGKNPLIRKSRPRNTPPRA